MLYRNCGTTSNNTGSEKTVPMSEYDKQSIERILLGEGDWFGARLLRLIQKADRSNRERLRAGFPEEVAEFEKWERGE